MSVSKHEEGVIKGAIRLANSEETLDSFYKITLASLEKNIFPLTQTIHVSLPLVGNLIHAYKLARSK